MDLPCSYADRRVTWVIYGKPTTRTDVCPVQYPLQTGTTQCKLAGASGRAGCILSPESSWEDHLLHEVKGISVLGNGGQPSDNPERKIVLPRKDRSEVETGTGGIF